MFRKHFARQLWLNTVLLSAVLFFHVERQLRWYPPSSGISAEGDLLHRLVVGFALVSVAAILLITGATMGINWIARQVKR